MKKLPLVLALMIAAGAAAAADAMPALLCDQATLTAKTVSSPPGVCAPAPAPVVAACSAPPPVASCPAPAPIATSAAYCNEVVMVPVKSVAYEVRTVPVKKRVWVDENYTATERRSEVYNEVRTRTAYKTVPYYATREVQDGGYAKIQPTAQGNAPRLARRVTRKMEIYEAKEKQAYQETYIQPVRTTVEVPVVKTRKVAVDVNEVKTVTVPVTVTTLEAKTVKKRFR